MKMDDIKPAIWRRVLLESKTTLSELAYIIMTVFEMQAEHLFSITVPTAENFLKLLSGKSLEYFHEVFDGPDKPAAEMTTFEIPNDMDDDFGPADEDARREKLHDVLKIAGCTLSMHYDFGDDWHVQVTLEEEIRTEMSAKELPRVLEGAGFGIVENCGGAYGLAQLAKAYKKKTGIEYKNYVEWLGFEDFDLGAFDIDDLNFRLKKLPRIFRDAYEYQLKPTKRSIDFLERKYLRAKKL